MASAPGIDVRDILLDGHVHFHGCFDQGRFFDSASANLRAGGRAVGLPETAAHCLLFTEGVDDDFFERLRQVGTPAASGPWQVHPTSEDCSLLARGNGADSLILVAGRQIATREGLEVLAIGCRSRFARGLSLPDAIDATLAQNAIPVIPWGFGKWWFGRGRLLEALLRAPATPRLFLGDNSGRPRLSGTPRLFALGRERGFFVLPGSDPLPFPGQVTNVGRYGFVLRGSLDPERPAGSIRRHIADLAQQPPVFGRRESLAGFVRSQVGMQLRKRQRATPS